MDTVKSVLGLIYFLYFHIFITDASDTQYLGLCGNSQCNIPIGMGKTLLIYSPIENNKLRFQPNEEVTIFVKEYGEKKNLIGVMHASGRGYIGKDFIRETEIFVKSSELVSAEVEFRSQTDSTTQAHSSISSKEQQVDHTKSLPIVNSEHKETSDRDSPRTESFQSSPVMDQSQTQNEMTDSANKNLDSSMKFPNSPASELGNLINLKPSNILHSDSAPAVHPDNNVDSSPTTSLKSSNNLIKPSSQSEQLESKDHTKSYVNNNKVIDTLMKPSSSSDNLHSVKSTNSHNDFNDKSQSFKSNEDYPHEEEINADVSETFALLKERGIDETYIAEENDESVSSSSTSKIPLPKTNTEQVNMAYINSAKRHQDLNDISSSSVLQGESTVVATKEKDSQNSFNSQENAENEIDDDDEYSDNDTDEDEEEDLLSGIHSTQSTIVPNIHETDAHASRVDNETYQTKVFSADPSTETPSHTTASLIDLKSSHVVSDENFEVKVKATNSITKEPSFNKAPDPQTTDSQSSNTKLEQDCTHTSYIKNTHANSLLQSSEFLENSENSKVIPSVNNDEQSISSVNDLKQDVENSKNDAEIDATSTNPPEENQSSTVNQDENTKKEQFQSSASENHVLTDSVDSNSTANLDSDDNSELNNTQGLDSGDNSELNNTQGLDSGDNSELNDTQGLDSGDNSELNNTQALDSDDSSKNGALNDNVEDNSDINQRYYDALSLDFHDDSKNVTVDTNIVEDNSDVKNVDNAHTFDSEDDYVTSTVLNSYQIRDLKGESSSTESSNSEYENKVESSLFDFSFNEYVQSWLDVLRAFTETVMMVIPEPLYSYIMDFEKKGIPPRAIVFTALSAIPCLLLIIGTVYIKESSKEKKLSDQLLVAEKHLHSFSVEKQMLEEKIQVLTTELSDIQTSFEKEKEIVEELNSKLHFSKEQEQDYDQELKTSLETIDFLQKKEEEYLSALSALQKEKNSILEQTENLEKRLKEEEDSVTSLATQVQELEEDVKKLEDEKEGFIQAEVNYEGKISQLQLNCKQLLEEAEVWNIRVTDLSNELIKEKSLKEDFEKMVTTKDTEIESMKHIIQTLESFENSCGSEESGLISMEEKLKSFMDVSNTKIQLQREQEEKEALLEKLMLEKSKVLDFEVEMLEAKSEISKLKNSYNQALQDKSEAQTKLDVLSNYFKDKEIQLQKQLGKQEAVRQRTEDDASSAERRICLIEEENISYKYQVESMKQEMEETERNLKNQIAAQEKKAHENWLSARAAERKLEEVKQEAAQLRQRITLFERESEAYANSAHDDVVRPVPKRLPGPSEKAMNTLDGNNSMDMRYGGFEQHLPLPPLMLPPDRPRPPLLPPPMMPGFLPPHLDPGMPPPFRPWHDAFHESEFHPSPPDYMRRREMTPPRGHQSLSHDHEFGPHTSSPISVDIKDSRNSTPPHALPNFHDIPPRPLMPPFPPMAMHSRLPLHPPPLRREHQAPRPAGPPRTPPSQQNQSPISSERWHHSNSQV